MSQLKTVDITAQNVFTDIFDPSDANDFAVSISGTFVATVGVYRSLDSGVTWNALDTTYTAPIEINVIPTPGCLYRVGVPTGSFTSGTVAVKARW